MSGSVVPCSECGCNTYNNQDPCQHCINRILAALSSEADQAELAETDEAKRQELLEADKHWGFYANKGN
jgi:hypothetical protein